MTARVDMAKYKQGAATMRNFFVDYRSGASTRSGTRFVIQTLGQSKVRLIPFQFSVANSYVLEFGDHYIRFVSNGGAVLEPAFALNGASNSLPAYVSAPGQNFNVGDWLFINGVTGATGYNNKFYKVSALSGSNVYLSDVNNNVTNSATFGIYAGGGTIARVYIISSPYAAADLGLLKYTQSASVLTLTHPRYPPYNLQRVTPTNWVLTAINFAPTIDPPASTWGFATPPPAGATANANYAYIITSVDANGQESLQSPPAYVNNAVDIGNVAGTISVGWTPVTNAVQYNVYKAEVSLAGQVPANVAFGFVGYTNTNEFIDSNIVPDFTTSPQIFNNPFANGNYPGVAAYFQSRLVFGSSYQNPMTFWMSQPGVFNNFNITVPSLPDNSIEGTLVSDQVNAIKSFKSMQGGLVTLTARGAWVINGGGSPASGGGAVTPGTITAAPQAYNGASDLQPIVSNYDILYVQAKNQHVRDLSYNLYAAIYTGTDISVLSNHLFSDYLIDEWGWAEEPHKQVWAIRDDGILLSLTFMKEQEIYGWSRHETFGDFVSVAVVGEADPIDKVELVDVPYFVVKRAIGGRWVQYIERMQEREFWYGAEDSWCVDCGVQTVLPTPAANLYPAAVSGNTTFSTDAPVFNSSMIGWVIRGGGGIAVITGYISPIQVSVSVTQPIKDQHLGVNVVQASVQDSGDWSLAQPFTTFSGLDHLEGQTVSILADGGVVAPQQVINGTITLANPATKVTAGLGFTCQLQTMRLDTGNTGEGGTIQGKRKKLAAVTVRAADTRGVYIGTTFNTLVPAKELYKSTLLNNPQALITGDERIIMDPSWNTEGQVCIQVSDPLPATILGVIPEIIIGDTVR